MLIELVFASRQGVRFEVYKQQMGRMQTGEEAADKWKNRVLRLLAHFKVNKIVGEKENVSDNNDYIFYSICLTTTFLGY